MNARTKTFNFPFRGTENHQAYVSTNVRKTLDTTRDDVGGYSKIQLGEFPAGPVNCRSGSGPSRPASVGRTRGPNRDAQSQVQQLSQLQFEIRENEPIRSGEDRYRAVELITSAR